MADHSQRNPERPIGQRRFAYFRNTLSGVGLAIALVAGAFHLSLFALEYSRGVHNPYLNIWFHILIPPVVVAGFALAGIGALRERRRLKAPGGAARGPTGASARKGLVLGGALSVVLLLPFLALTTYSGHEFTDSVEFCGKVCHVPMQPVYTAYQVSPHARVSCSSCHIGEGASWFVRSKLSGTRQVFAAIFDSFDRPIATPIRNLRPARETCERCHWPEKFFGSRVVDLPHYASDEENTRRPLSMVLKTGGGDPRTTEVRGIHWHFLASHETEYVATDEKRLEIPWVKVTTESGVRIYRSDGLPADAPPPAGERRRMDCLDCHNRPSHNYRTPDELTNVLFSHGLLDASLPYLKREAARLMAQPYEDTPSAVAAITQGLEEFYRENYPEVAASRAEELARCTELVVDAFRNNVFPEMRTDWRTHPDHIGHKYFPGCFRCHDDGHVADDGTAISRDCGLCHEFMEHKEEEGTQLLVRGGYNHPFELGTAHEGLNCHACHDGGPTPAASCEGCHREVADLQAGRFAPLPELSGAPHPHKGELECTDCHEESRRFTAEEIVPQCMECHDEEEHIETVRRLLDELEEARREAGDSILREGVDRAGPIHNLEFALKILGGDTVRSESDTD